MRDLRRWLKRVALGTFVILALVSVVVFGVRLYLNQAGTRELVQATARLDREETGWRLESIELAREKSAPLPDQNSASIVLKAAESIAPEQNKEWTLWRGSEQWTSRFATPNLPGDEFRAGMLNHREPTAEARNIARGVRQFPFGYHPLVMQRNPYMTLLPHVQKCREVVALLEYDSLLAAAEGDAEGGVEAAHAALNVGRSIADEPFLISQLVRIACCRISSQSVMQVLAWGEPRKGLAELQAAYRAEADAPFLLIGLRGERGALHRMFEGLESGELKYSDLVIHGIQKEGPVQEAAFYLYKGLLPGDHAKALEVLSAYVAAAKLPPHQQHDAIAAIPIPPGPPEDFRYIVTRLLTPACGKVATAALRIRAEMLSASTAIACERFRLARGRWPEHLEEIPKDVLPDVPIDPFTGVPLIYRRLADGIAVFSVGDDDPNAARRRVETHDPLAGLGLGWRLWNPNARRQSPRAAKSDPGMP